MKRVRLILQQISITKQNEVKNFQIRLPKNITSILGIETDVLMLSNLDLSNKGNSNLRELTWSSKYTPVLGKLKLQSMECDNIFFEYWLSFIPFDGGLTDQMKLFSISPYSLNKNTQPKKVNIPAQTCINGFYKDSLGQQLGKDMSYILKVFVWGQTTEDAKGIEFDFQQTQEIK